MLISHTYSALTELVDLNILFVLGYLALNITIIIIHLWRIMFPGCGTFGGWFITLRKQIVQTIELAHEIVRKDEEQGRHLLWWLFKELPMDKRPTAVPPKIIKEPIFSKDFTENKLMTLVSGGHPGDDGNGGGGNKNNGFRLRILRAFVRCLITCIKCYRAATLLKTWTKKFAEENGYTREDIAKLCLRLRDDAVHYFNNAMSFLDVAERIETPALIKRLKNISLISVGTQREKPLEEGLLPREKLPENAIRNDWKTAEHAPVNLNIRDNAFEEGGPLNPKRIAYVLESEEKEGARYVNVLNFKGQHVPKVKPLSMDELTNAEDLETYHDKKIKEVQNIKRRLRKFPTRVPDDIDDQPRDADTYADEWFVKAHLEELKKVEVRKKESAERLEELHYERFSELTGATPRIGKDHPSLSPTTENRLKEEVSVLREKDLIPLMDPELSNDQRKKLHEELYIKRHLSQAEDNLFLIKTEPELKELDIGERPSLATHDKGQHPLLVTTDQKEPLATVTTDQKEPLLATTDQKEPLATDSSSTKVMDESSSAALVVEKEGANLELVPADENDDQDGEDENNDDYKNYWTNLLFRGAVMGLATVALGYTIYKAANALTEFIDELIKIL